MTVRTSGLPTVSRNRYLPAFDRSIYLLLAVYGSLALLALLLIPRFFLPAEDAVILFQYSRNLAHHGAITFLANGAHVEGATDFAWMALIAAGSILHIPPFWFCAGINALALVVLGVLLLKLSQQRMTLLRLLAVMGAIASMPQILAAASGFAVLVDAALLTALVLSAVRNKIATTAVIAFIFCLFRPDGVVFAVPLLLFLIFSQRSISQNLLRVLGLFVLPGIIYFVWRWRYFGHLFPLPFLVKSDTHRTLGILVPLSLHQSLVYLVFTAILLLTAIYRRRVRFLWLLVPLIACPTLFYWAMRLDQNVAARFFYYLPLSAAIFIAINWHRLGSRQIILFRTAVVVWLLLLAGPFIREIRTFRDEQFNTVKNIATALAQLPQHGTILTTEAGFLPYFSGWKTYDAWGLNTPQFALEFIQRQDVAELMPDLVVLHPDQSESCVANPLWLSNYPDRTWSHMTRNLVMGADSSQYELWLTSYGSEFYRRRKHWQYGQGDRECWFIRKASPLYADIKDILRANHAVPPDKSLQLESQHQSVRPS